MRKLNGKERKFPFFLGIGKVKDEEGGSLRKMLQEHNGALIAFREQNHYIGCEKFPKSQLWKTSWP